MISKFILKNFMSWKYAEFEISDGITIFSGISNKGKSAILNGLQWLKDNKPNGIEFVSDWAKKKKKNGDFELIEECSFTAIVDGIEVTRARGPNTNEYRISTLKEPLKAIGQSVPEEVSNILNLSDINIQDQDTPHFLIGDKPPEIGRQLNQIASLSDIDIAFRNADSTIRSLNADIKRTEKELEIDTEKLKQYDWIDNAENDLIELEKIQSDMAFVRLQDKEMRDYQTKIINLKSNIDRYERFNGASEDISRALSIKYQIEVLSKETNELIDIEEKLNDYLDQIKNADKILSAKKDIESLLKLKSQIDELAIETDALIDIEDKIIESEVKMKNAELELNKVIVEYEKIKPEQCPLCGNDMK